MLMEKCPDKLSEFYEKIRVALLQNLGEVPYSNVVNANVWVFVKFYRGFAALRCLLTLLVGFEMGAVGRGGTNSAA